MNRILLLLATLGCLSGGIHDLSAAPNIVVFITDDHDQADVSPYGAKDARTPNFQRLADSGMVFTRAFVASPSCAPSRAALLTGLMPARNGAEANHSRPRDFLKKLPAYLQELGYEVAAFGKVAHYGQAKEYGFDVTGAGKYNDPDNVPSALRYLKNRDSRQPLCLFVGTHEPHVPWPENDGYHPEEVNLPPTHVDTPETRRFRARYYSAVSDADRMFGDLYDLAREKLGSDTAFLFTSDHGAQWPFGKWNLYDAGIRVPLLVSWPGVIEAGARSEAMVSWIDLLPTLVELAGGTPPKDIDGRSFAGVLRGETHSHRDSVFTTHSGDGRMNVYPIRSVRADNWKLIWNLRPEFAHTTHIDKALAADGGRYWLSWFEKARTNAAAAAMVKRYHERPAYELYDLVDDPFEQRNLAKDPAQAGRVKVLRVKLEDWMERQGDRRTVFKKPRLLSDPASTRPGPNADSETR